MSFRRVCGASLLALVAVVGALLAPQAASAEVVVGYQSTPEVSWIPNGRVYAIAEDADRVYIGGGFTKVKNPATGKSVARNRLAAFDAETGELDTSWNPGADGTVRALTLAPDGTLYAGGAFLNAGGVAATRVVALDPAGAALPTFSAAPSGDVRDFALVGDSLFIAGNFGSVGSVGRVGLAKVDAATGDVVSSWNARIGAGRVQALGVSGDRLVIGGNFKKVAGAPVWFLSSLDPTTGQRSTWTPQRICDTCNVLDLTTDGDAVYVAAAGGGGGRAGAYSQTTDLRTWVKRGDGDVQAIAYRDGVVYAGGHFVYFDGVERHQVAALDAVAGTLLPYAISFTGDDDPGVWALTADSARLRIGGGFQGIADSASARYAVMPALLTSS